MIHNFSVYHPFLQISTKTNIQPDAPPKTQCKVKKSTFRKGVCVHIFSLKKMAAIKATTAASNCLGRKASGVSSTSRSSSYRRHANVHEQTCLRTLFVHHQNTESSFVQRRLSDFRSRRTQRQKNGRQCTTCLFTGIVQGTAVVKEVCEQKDFKQLQVEFPVGRMDSVQIGGSVALNGTCLTVTEAERNTLSFDVIVETLRATNLGGLNAGHVVNFER